MCTCVKYRLDLGRHSDIIKGAKESYRAGSKVRIFCQLEVCDADLIFRLDDDKISEVKYDHKRFGYWLSFAMPPRDVRLRIFCQPCMRKEDLEREPQEI